MVSYTQWPTATPPSIRMSFCLETQCQHQQWYEKFKGAARTLHCSLRPESEDARIHKSPTALTSDEATVCPVCKAVAHIASEAFFATILSLHPPEVVPRLPVF